MEDGTATGPEGSSPGVRVRVLHGHGRRAGVRVVVVMVVVVAGEAGRGRRGGRVGGGVAGWLSPDRGRRWRRRRGHHGVGRGVHGRVELVVVVLDLRHRHRRVGRVRQRAVGGGRERNLNRCINTVGHQLKDYFCQLMHQP